MVIKKIVFLGVAMLAGSAVCDGSALGKQRTNNSALSSESHQRTYVH
jgi:hypothetical protein